MQVGAFFTVFKQCKNGDHANCPGTVPGPGNMVCGGGTCACECHRANMEICPECGGDGKKNNVTCFRCDGWGEIKKERK